MTVNTYLNPEYGSAVFAYESLPFLNVPETIENETWTLIKECFHPARYEIDVHALLNCYKQMSHLTVPCASIYMEISDLLETFLNDSSFLPNPFYNALDLSEWEKTDVCYHLIYAISMHMINKHHQGDPLPTLYWENKAKSEHYFGKGCFEREEFEKAQDFFEASHSSYWNLLNESEDQKALLVYPILIDLSSTLCQCVLKTNRADSESKHKSYSNLNNLYNSIQKSNAALDWKDLARSLFELGKHFDEGNYLVESHTCYQQALRAYQQINEEQREPFYWKIFFYCNKTKASRLLSDDKYSEALIFLNAALNAAKKMKSYPLNALEEIHFSVEMCYKIMGDRAFIADHYRAHLFALEAEFSQNREPDHFKDLSSYFSFLLQKLKENEPNEQVRSELANLLQTITVTPHDGDFDFIPHAISIAKIYMEAQDYATALRFLKLAKSYHGPYLFFYPIEFDYHLFLAEFHLAEGYQKQGNEVLAVEGYRSALKQIEHRNVPNIVIEKCKILLLLGQLSEKVDIDTAKKHYRDGIYAILRAADSIFNDSYRELLRRCIVGISRVDPLKDQPDQAQKYSNFIEIMDRLESDPHHFILCSYELGKLFESSDKSITQLFYLLPLPVLTSPNDSFTTKLSHQQLISLATCLNEMGALLLHSDRYPADYFTKSDYCLASIPEEKRNKDYFLKKSDLLHSRCISRLKCEEWDDDKTVYCQTALDALEEIPDKYSDISYWEKKLDLGLRLAWERHRRTDHEQNIQLIESMPEDMKKNCLHFLYLVYLSAGLFFHEEHDRDLALEYLHKTLIFNKEVLSEIIDKSINLNKELPKYALEGFHALTTLFGNSMNIPQLRKPYEGALLFLEILLDKKGFSGEAFVASVKKLDTITQCIYPFSSDKIRVLSDLAKRIFPVEEVEFFEEMKTMSSLLLTQKNINIHEPDGMVYTTLLRIVMKAILFSQENDWFGHTPIMRTLTQNQELLKDFKENLKMLEARQISLTNLLSSHPSTLLAFTDHISDVEKMQVEVIHSQKRIEEQHQALTKLTHDSSPKGGKRGTEEELKEGRTVKKGKWDS